MESPLHRARACRRQAISVQKRQALALCRKRATEALASVALRAHPIFLNYRWVDGDGKGCDGPFPESLIISDQIRF